MCVYFYAIIEVYTVRLFFCQKISPLWAYLGLCDYLALQSKEKQTLFAQNMYKGYIMDKNTTTWGT